MESFLNLGGGGRGGGFFFWLGCIVVPKGSLKRRNKNRNKHKINELMEDLEAKRLWKENCSLVAPARVNLTSKIRGRPRSRSCWDRHFYKSQQRQKKTWKTCRIRKAMKNMNLYYWKECLRSLTLNVTTNQYKVNKIRASPKITLTHAHAHKNTKRYERPLGTSV